MDEVLKTPLHRVFYLNIYFRILNVGTIQQFLKDCLNYHKELETASVPVTNL